MGFFALCRGLTIHGQFGCSRISIQFNDINQDLCYEAMLQEQCSLSPLQGPLPEPTMGGGGVVSGRAMAMDAEGTSFSSQHLQLKRVTGDRCWGKNYPVSKTD